MPSTVNILDNYMKFGYRASIVKSRPTIFSKCLHICDEDIILFQNIPWIPLQHWRKMLFCRLTSLIALGHQFFGLVPTVVYLAENSH